MSLLPNDTFYGPGLPIWLKNPISSIIVSSGTIQNLTVNNIQFPYQLLSSISSALLLNGVAIATVDNISSLSEWSYDPAISTVRINNNNITGISTFFAETGFTSSLNTTNLLATNIITSNLAAYNIVNFYSTSIETFTSTIISEIDLARISSAQIGVEFVSSASISSLSVIAGNANSLSVSSLNVSSGNVILSNATIADLSVTNSASFAGSRPNFTTGINTSGPNNFNNATLDNVGRITANTVFIGSPNYINTQTSSFTAILNNRGADVGGNSVIDIKSQFGAATRVNITADASSALAPTPTQIITLTANGATSLTQNAVGGRVSIVANAGSGSGCNILGFGQIDMTAYSSAPFAGVIKESAGSILAYSGLTVPTVGVFGSGFYSALNCLSLTAGATPATTSFPGVVFLRGDNGTKVLNGFFVDTINNTVLYDLDISSKTAGDISNRNLNINSACNLVLNSSNGGQVIINGAAYPPSPGAGVWASTATTALNMAGFGIINLTTLTALSGYDITINAPSRTINLTGNFINLVGGSGIILNGNITGSALLTMNSAGVINLSGGNLSNVGNIFGSNLSITTGGNLTLGSSTGGSVNINSRTNISSITVSSINGASYPPASGSGVWASTATTALNMSGFDINNAGRISSLDVFANTAVIGTPTAFGNTFAYFGNNSLASNGGEYALLQDNIGTTFLNAKLYRPLYLRNGNYDIMILDDVQIQAFKPLNMNSYNITNVNTLSALSTQQISINQTSGSDFTLFNNGDTRINAVRDAYVQGDRDVYVISQKNMNVRCPDTCNITIQQTGTGNQSYIQLRPDGIIDISPRTQMEIKVLSTNNITLQQLGPGNQSYFQLTQNGNIVLNARTYFEAIANAGTGGIYLTGAFTELRGYLTFNTSNNYINNLGHIYGDAGAPGGGLGIDNMYGLFFNSSGKNANLYVDSGNLNMINYNSGINIANYNGYGTGNVSLYSQNNDVYVATGSGRDVNINGGRYVGVNAAQPGGAFNIYTSTINATSLVATNVTIGQDLNITATGSAQLRASYFNFFNDCYFNNRNLFDMQNIYFGFGPYITRYIPGGFSNAFLDINGAGGDGQLRLINGSAEVALRANSDLGITPTSGYNIVLNGPISANSNLNMNCNAISNVGAFSRFLISTDIPQPIIQFGQVSSSGSFGSVIVTIPQRYTSVTSYLPFACMADAPAAEIYVSTLTRATFEIGWQNGGGGAQLFNWNTMGT